MSTARGGARTGAAGGQATVAEMLTEEFWRTHRCPWCNAPGLFTHQFMFEALMCDACGASYHPQLAIDRGQLPADSQPASPPGEGTR